MAILPDASFAMVVTRRLPTTNRQAHGGTFFPAPASPWINEHTCGQCHDEQVRVQWQSLMMTEAGKIQGVCWAFGSLTGYQHRWANYAVDNPQNPQDRLGTAGYRAYMEALKSWSPVFLSKSTNRFRRHSESPSWRG